MPKRTTREKVSPRMFIAFVVAGLVLSAATLIFAQTDKGVINVAEVINQSNISTRENLKDGESAPTPVANSRSETPNGGLVGTGKPEEEHAPVQESEVDETATSTTETTNDDSSTGSDGSENENTVEENPESEEVEAE